MKRRAFLAGIAATAGGILVPWEPRRVYGFAPAGGWPLPPMYEIRIVDSLTPELHKLIERMARLDVAVVLPRDCELRIVPENPETVRLRKQKPT